MDAASRFMTPCLDENVALELIEGRLASTARTTLERHLEACNPCRELVAELAKVDDGEAGARDEERGEERSADTERTPLGAGEPLPPGSHVGPYVVHEAIGQGSAGTVHRAVDGRTGNVVALKLLTDSSLRARFSREVATLARLEHDAIVRYVGHGETPGGMYLAMEWLEGEDLEQALHRGPIDCLRALALGLRIASALAYAHARGCVHRDLSPRNVFLCGGAVERAKLLDFGLVRVHDGELARTTSQAVLGTPFYMAPEQVRDPKSVDGRADLFSLGVLLYEAVSGVRPFEGEDLFSVWVKIVDLPAPDLRRAGVVPYQPLPEPFVRLVEALLAKDPNLRPSSADEVCQVLQTFAAALPFAPTQPLAPPFPPPPPPLQTHPPPLRPPTQQPSLPVRSLPPAMAQSEAPPRSSGVWIIGVVAVVLLALGGGAGGLVYAFRDELRARLGDEAASSTGAATASPSPKSPPSSAPVPPSANANPNPNPNPNVDPHHAPLETFVCGGDSVQHHRGGHYEPARNMVDIGEAVIVGGSCNLTLEDCIIEGPHSVQVIGEASLVLRRCQVHGAVQLVGAVTLQLENTTLPQAPVVVGKGRVIRR